MSNPRSTILNMLVAVSAEWSSLPRTAQVWEVWLSVRKVISGQSVHEKDTGMGISDQCVWQSACKVPATSGCSYFFFLSYMFSPWCDLILVMMKMMVVLVSVSNLVNLSLYSLCWSNRIRFPALLCLGLVWQVILKTGVWAQCQWWGGGQVRV